MRNSCRFLLTLTLLGAATSGLAADVPGTFSRGNVDGVLTWEVGCLEPGQQAERTVIFLHAPDLETARGLLARARSPVDPRVAPRREAVSERSDTKPGGLFWIEGKNTDFAVQADGAFYWEEAGRNYPDGLVRVTWDAAWPESGNGPSERICDPDYHTAGRFTAYKSPYPLTEQDFLVSARPEGDRWKIYLMDTSGNRELIHEGVHNAWYPIPLRPRKKPPVIPQRPAWPVAGEPRSDTGMFFSSDVREGTPGVPPESVRYLRVIRSDYKTYTLWARDYRYEGPAVSIVQAESVKQILGTVPVEEDGSVCFKAPSGVPLHFQLLDGEYRALHTMRSFTGLMPGERRGCTGCHEGQHRPPANRQSLALRLPPREITPPPWGDATIGYERMVQPVLDKHCGGCHQGDGEARKKLDLTLRPGKGIFKEPYITLIRSGVAGVIPVEGYDQRDPESYATYPALKSLSATSQLIEHASSGRHHDVQVRGAELRQLIGWVDAMGPYRGLDEVRALDDPRCSKAPVIARP